jgi:hypothetical protein
MHRGLRINSEEKGIKFQLFLILLQDLRQMPGGLYRSRHRRQGEEVRERHRRHHCRQRGGVGEVVATNAIFPARKSLLDP